MKKAYTVIPIITILIAAIFTAIISFVAPEDTVKEAQRLLPVSLETKRLIVAATIIIIVLLFIAFKKKKSENIAETQEESVNSTQEFTQPTSYTLPSLISNIANIGSNTEQNQIKPTIASKTANSQIGDIPIAEITDLNHDGKIDILDVMIAIKQQRAQANIEEQ